ASVQIGVGVPAVLLRLFLLGTLGDDRLGGEHHPGHAPGGVHPPRRRALATVRRPSGVPKIRRIGSGRRAKTGGPGRAEVDRQLSGIRRGFSTSAVFGKRTVRTPLSKWASARAVSTSCGRGIARSNRPKYR